MTKLLDEKDVSHGFRGHLSIKVKVIPQCNVCVNWNGRGKCKIYGESPEIYMNGKKYDCEGAIIDKECFLYEKYIELLEEKTGRS